jgi:ABC-type glycerol-3-phosphate transport system substrate-binding protein
LDLVMGAHDWIGNLVQNGAIDPLQLTDDTRAAFNQLAIKGVTYNGQVYGIPYAIENVVLFRNTDLAPEAPKTLEDLVAKGKELKAAGKVSEIMALPVGPNGDAYHMYPIYTSAGGYLFGKTADGDYDPKDLGLTKPEAARAFEKIHDLGEKGDGALKRSIAAENVTSLFTGKKTAFLLSGPWQLPDIDKSGVHYAISPSPGSRAARRPGRSRSTPPRSSPRTPRRWRRTPAPRTSPPTSRGPSSSPPSPPAPGSASATRSRSWSTPSACTSSTPTRATPSAPRSLPATPASGPGTSSGQWPRRAAPTGRTAPGR